MQQPSEKLSKRCPKASLKKGGARRQPRSPPSGGGTFFKEGGTSARQKTMENFFH